MRKATSLLIVLVVILLAVAVAGAQGSVQRVYLPALRQAVTPTPPPPTAVPPAPTPPAATPVPDPQPQAVFVRDYQTFVQGSSRYIIGEVVNNTGKPAALIRLDERFYDSAGALIYTDFTFVSKDLVAPGERALFYDIDSAPPSGIARVEVSVASWAERTGLDYRDLAVVSHQARPSQYSWFQITGEVRNDQTVIMRGAQIFVTFYDASGKVVNVAVGYASNPTLRPGESTVFAINTVRNVPHATYQVVAQGYVQP